jgi:hypothetical protein
VDSLEGPGPASPGSSLSAGRRYLLLGFPSGVGVAGHELYVGPAPRRPLVGSVVVAEPASRTTTQQVDGEHRPGPGTLAEGFEALPTSFSAPF